MASPFSFHLIGEDISHLRALANQLEAHVHEMESVLSAYAPHAELFRINQEAKHRPVRCSVGLGEALRFTLKAYTLTQGYFDIGWQKKRGAFQEKPLSERLSFDIENRTVKFQDPDLQLDLGGVGKGYALDVCAKELNYWGIQHYLLDAGNSSFLARGHRPDGKRWNVFHSPSETPFFLSHSALSFSQIPSGKSLHEGIYNPAAGSLVSGSLGYIVEGESAGLTEIYSTALLAMGREKAADFAASTLSGSYRVKLFDTLHRELITLIHNG